MHLTVCTLATTSLYFLLKLRFAFACATVAFHFFHAFTSFAALSTRCTADSIHLLESCASKPKIDFSRSPPLESCGSASGAKLPFFLELSKTHLIHHLSAFVSVCKARLSTPLGASFTTQQRSQPSFSLPSSLSLDISPPSAEIFVNSFKKLLNFYGSARASEIR